MIQPHQFLFCGRCSFAVMVRCWCGNPEERPGFSELCSILDQQLSLVSDYSELKMALPEEQLDVHGMRVLICDVCMSTLFS